MCIAAREESAERGRGCSFEAVASAASGADGTHLHFTPRRTRLRFNPTNYQLHKFQTALESSLPSLAVSRVS